jgi:aarF domain-containing kinase
MQQTIHFPHELLFISRNMNLVRSLNKHYGGKVDRISIMAKTAYIGSKYDLNNESKKDFRYNYNSIIFSVKVYIL